ncbi:MAG: SapC family protein [Mesorhizobium sp.]|uniref:SapC family protein n=2 Tax=Mesorhizobium TaxID=68287 RepID=UPI000FD52CE9|nr:SapC family protein [Mesorhizobium sp.]RVC63410.1 SapC family protein [Mesorhizobium sp. M4B.F.Ca.ET.088.02.2.1]RWF34163.1 MAG: SapC family protein [Mesorhizobium sp.]RWF42873.1 MAG: SapC family protein [Mesorhizobium sp.]TJW03327.1 MAG: SapC family protein [Mesorhizobium sp.]
MSDLKTQTAPAAADTGLPLFYSRPEALNPIRHGSLGLTARADFSFARSAHAIPVVASEMPAAMRSYPIVFIGVAKAPVIITGVRQNENLFVDTDGRWSEPHYIPAYVRRYPFILADETKTAGRLTLCIDRASERVIDQLLAPFREDGGKIAPFFNGTEPTEATRQALAFCNQFQADFNATRAMIEKIDAHGLFAPRQSKVTLEGGEVLNLTDFQVIDEVAFSKLSDEAFLDLRKSGALGMLYCHLASSNSWTSLVYQASTRKDGRK